MFQQFSSPPSSWRSMWQRNKAIFPLSYRSWRRTAVSPPLKGSNRTLQKQVDFDGRLRVLVAPKLSSFKQPTLCEARGLTKKTPTAAFSPTPSLEIRLLSYKNTDRAVRKTRLDFALPLPDVAVYRRTSRRYTLFFFITRSFILPLLY